MSTKDWKDSTRRLLAGAIGSVCIFALEPNIVEKSPHMIDLLVIIGGMLLLAASILGDTEL